MDIKEDIHRLEEEKRKLINNKFIRKLLTIFLSYLIPIIGERHMNKVIMAGQPEAMDEIQKKVKELTVLFDRDTKV